MEVIIKTIASWGDKFVKLDTLSQLGIVFGAAYITGVGIASWMKVKVFTLMKDKLMEHVFKSAEEASAFMSQFPGWGTAVSNAATFNYGGIKFLSLFGVNCTNAARRELINIGGRVMRIQDKKRSVSEGDAKHKSQVKRKLNEKLTKEYKAARDLIAKYKIDPLKELNKELRKGTDVFKNEGDVLDYMHLFAILMLATGDFVRAKNAKTDEQFEKLDAFDKRSAFWYEYMKVFIYMYKFAEEEKPIEYPKGKEISYTDFWCHEDIVTNLNKYATEDNKREVEGSSSNKDKVEDDSIEAQAKKRGIKEGTYKAPKKDKKGKETVMV